MNKIMKKNSKRGKKTIQQLDETKLAVTLTIEEAKDNLFLKQQAMTMINTARMKTPTASKILVVSFEIKGSLVAPS